MNLSNVFGRVRRAATFLEDLFSGESPLDPLDEDPHYVLTQGERASIRARRGAISDPMVRADVTHLLSAVESLGDRLREIDEDEKAIDAHFAKTLPDIGEWLAQTYPKSPFGDRDPLALITSSPTRLEVLSALIGMNGGTVVKEFGRLSPGGPYGRMGLTIDECVALTHLNAYILGWCAASGERHDLIEEMVAREIQRASAARASAMHPLVPTKTMSACATELYVDGQKVADLNDLTTKPS